MDEIYEGWENALSPKTFSDLANWIIKPLLESKSIEFTKYDWYLEERNEKIVINNPKVLIIEGVGSSSSEISEYACLKLWIEVDKEIGISRVLTRDGQQIQEQMKNGKPENPNSLLKTTRKKIQMFGLMGIPW